VLESSLVLDGLSARKDYLNRHLYPSGNRFRNYRAARNRWRHFCHRNPTLFSVGWFWPC